jgi:tetratricopeptide (TPR) repeat protein
MKVRKLRSGLVLAALVGLVGWFGWRWYTTPVPPRISLDGVNKERAEKVEQALEEVRRHPRSGKHWGELSRVLLANGFAEESIPCFAHAQRFDPREPRWPYFQGALRLLHGHRDGFAKLREALALARSSRERGPILFQLSIALVEDGQLDEAQQRLKELSEIGWDPAAVDFGLGLLALGREDRAAAVTHLSRITENPSARNRACSLLAGLIEGNEELAQDYRRRAEQLPDDQPWPGSFESELQRYRVEPVRRLARSDELEAEGRHEEAIILLREFVEHSPDEAACFTLGFALFKANRFEEAERALRQAIGFNPRNAKAHLFLGVSLLQIGEKRYQDADGKEQALELFRQAVLAEDKALALQNDIADAHLTRGRALKYLGRTDESLAALRQAVLVGSEHAEMHQALGEALAEVGQLREALEHLENAVRVAKPQDPRPREVLQKWRAKAKPSP